MSTVEPVAVLYDSLVICRIDGNTTIAGLARSVVSAVRTSLVIEHEIPQNRASSATRKYAEEHCREVRNHAVRKEVEVPSVLPASDPLTD